MHIPKLFGYFLNKILILIFFLKIFCRSATFDNLTGHHLATVGGDKTIKIWSKEKRPEEGQSW